MSGRLAGETAIVTGSSSGIGKQIAKTFADEGANVVVNSRARERAQETVGEIEADGGTAVAVEADISEEASATHLVEEAVDEYGRLDVMVNNAGIVTIQPAMELDADDWNEVLDVNLTGLFFAARAAARQMRTQENGGSIVNISSFHSSVAVPGRSAYATSKAGVDNLTRSLAVELAEDEIRVNAIAPGMIDTGTAQSLKENTVEGGPHDYEWPRQDFGYQEVLNRIPLGRFGEADEIASTALHLAERTHYMTGEVLHCDGGWLAFGWGSKSP